MGGDGGIYESEDGRKNQSEKDMAFYTSDSDQCCCSALLFFHYAGKTAGDDTGQAYRLLYLSL